MKEAMPPRLRCPKCGAGLCELACSECGVRFPKLGEIADLRVFDPPYDSKDADWQHATELLRKSSQVSLADLIVFHFQSRPGPEGVTLPPDLVRRYINFKVNAREREQKQREEARSLMACLGVPVADGGLAVDIGCGTGGALVVLSAEFDHVIGIDISMSNLALAKKRLEEHDVLNVTLLAGCAESLPLPDGSARYVTASDVIEHVRDQERFMRDAYRLLDADGCFRLNSPNRYTLGREVHVNVFGVGFLPRAWQSRFVQIMRGIPYEHKRPLSYRELVCLCRAAADDKHRALTETEVIRHASIPAASTKGLLRRAVISSPFGAWVVSTLERRFGRSYVALLWR